MPSQRPCRNVACNKQLDFDDKPAAPRYSDCMSTSTELGHPCRLYLVSPTAFELGAFTKQLQLAFKGGDVGAFQLRLKNVSDAEIYEAARALLPIARDAGAAFILNDRPDIAAQVGAEGVHLGQEDLATWSIARTREALGSEGIIGVSCHDSSHLAMVAGEAGADYVAFGAFFPTTSKSPEALAKYGTPKIEMLEWWYQYTVLPCVAIGGMTPQNCGAAVTAGADFIAAINAMWNHPKGADVAVREFNHAIRAALKLRKATQAA